MGLLFNLFILASAAVQAAEPLLLPGEGLAVACAQGLLRSYGEAAQEAPMGSLAKLVWLQREGAPWENRAVSYRCSGKAGETLCWKREGHGTVDLEKALRVSCNLAFLAWASRSLEDRRRTQGESAARAGLEGDFGPFLGERLAPSERLGALSSPWVGDGTLLRATPAGFAAWLAAPSRAALRAQCAHLLSDRSGWWVKTGTAPVPGSPGATCAWAAGGNGLVIAVLLLPRGHGKQEGLERFRALLETAAP